MASWRITVKTNKEESMVSKKRVRNSISWKGTAEALGMEVEALHESMIEMLKENVQVLRELYQIEKQKNKEA